MTYEDNPAFPKGAKTVVLYGDQPSPDCSSSAPSSPLTTSCRRTRHPVFGSVTVLSGTMGSGMGETVDKSKGKVLEAGSLLLLPADHPHYVWAGDEEVTIQVTAIHRSTSSTSIRLMIRG